MRTRRAGLICCLLFIASIGLRAEDADPEIIVREAPQAWNSIGYYPVTIDMRSQRGAEVDVTITRDRGWGRNILTRRVAIPSNSSLRAEMTFPSPFFRVSYHSGEINDQRSLGFRSDHRNYLEDGYPAPLACLNSFMLRELELLDATLKPPGTIHSSLSLDEVPGRWQSYVGLASMLVANARETASLRPEQREAITIWVRWFGGRIWLVGEDAATAAANMGLSVNVPEGRNEDGAGVRRFPLGNGNVYLQQEANAATLVENLPKTGIINPLMGYFFLDYSDSETPGMWLLESLAGVSTNIIIVTLVILGLVMGPVNYFFIRSRRNSLLFFVTTPLIAIFGAIAIIGGAFFGEGMASGYNQFALLARNSVTGDSMLFDMRGVRAGFFAPSPRFSSDSLVVPITRRGETSEHVTDVSDGVTLTAGWLKPRFPSGFLVMRPVISRMGLSLEQEAGEWYIVNDMGYHVSQVAARRPDGEYGWAEDVAPGERKILRSDEDDSRLRGLYQRLKRLTDERPAFLGVTLVAQCEGLPYIEEGGMDSRKLSGEYYYALVGSPEGVGP